MVSLCDKHAGSHRDKKVHRINVIFFPKKKSKSFCRNLEEKTSGYDEEFHRFCGLSSNIETIGFSIGYC
jgi:hypothetical protein